MCEVKLVGFQETGDTVRVDTKVCRRRKAAFRGVFREHMRLPACAHCSCSTLISRTARCAGEAAVMTSINPLSTEAAPSAAPSYAEGAHDAEVRMMLR